MNIYEEKHHQFLDMRPFIWLFVYLIVCLFHCFVIFLHYQCVLYNNFYILNFNINNILTIFFPFRTPPFILDPANPFHNVAKERWSEKLNLDQFHAEYVQSGIEYQGRRKQSSPLAIMFSENTSTINSIERKGGILRRKYNSLPEESQGRSTLEKVVIVGTVLVMAFAELMSNDKKN